MTIRVLIADDHEVVRNGLVNLCSSAPEMHVVAEAFSGADALRLAVETVPDVVVLDLKMPAGDGLWVLERLKESIPTVGAVIVSGFDNPTYIARARALGASAYLKKTAKGEEYLDAIRRAARGEKIPDEVPLSMGSQIKLQRIDQALDLPLTHRETEVLRQMAQGLNNREIAQSLDIGAHTVKDHVQHILKKLGVWDRTQAAVWAVRKGIV